MNRSGQESHSYYSTVSALTLKDAKATSRLEEMPAASTVNVPLYILVSPVIIFFGLFIVAVIYQIIQKALTVKRLMGTAAIALIIASAPFIAQLLNTRSINPYLKASLPETPQAVKISVSPGEIIINWITVKPVTGAVKLLTSGIVSQPFTVIGNNGSAVTSHTVSLPVSRQGTYELEVLSGNSWYDDRGKPLIISVPY